MKKLLTTLGLAGMLAGSPSANAQINSTRAETNEDLVEIMAKEQSSSEDDGKTISFEDANTLQEQQQLFEEIMNDEKIQKLIDEYGQEEVEQIINEIVTNKDTKKIIEKSLKDKNIQKALKEGDRDGVEEGVEKIANEMYHGTFLGMVGKTAFTMVWGAVLGIIVWNKNKY